MYNIIDLSDINPRRCQYVALSLCSIKLLYNYKLYNYEFV